VARPRIRRSRALEALCKELCRFRFHATRPAFMIVGVLQPLAAMLKVGGGKAELCCIVCQDVGAQVDAFGS